MTDNEFNPNKIKAQFLLLYEGKKESYKAIENLIKHYVESNPEQSEISAIEKYTLTSLDMNPTYSIELKKSIAENTSADDLKSIVIKSIDDVIRTRKDLSSSEIEMYNDLKTNITVYKLHNQSI